jgi:hypothetical protein
MKHKTVTAAQVDTFIKSISGSYIGLSEPMMWARILYHFGVKRVTPSYSWLSGDEGQLNRLKVNVLSFVCEPQVIVTRPNRIHTTLVWYISDHFKNHHVGAAGDNYMQIGLNHIHDKWQPSKKTPWSVMCPMLTRYIHEIMANFLAIRAAKRRN